MKNKQRIAKYSYSNNVGGNCLQGKYTNTISNSTIIIKFYRAEGMKIKKITLLSNTKTTETKK